MHSDTTTSSPLNTIRTDNYVFKPATTEAELDQIHRLNYHAFVGEVRQHEDTGTGQLVDKFHEKNRYFVALRDDRVIGMIAVHDRPPFSAASRLDDPRALEELGDRLLEVRLLAVYPNERLRAVVAGLCWMMIVDARAHGYSHLLISALNEQLPLYKRLGFRALGPPKKTGDVWFTPMAMPVDGLPDSVERHIALWEGRVAYEDRGEAAQRLSFLPGPVQINPEVQAALARPPISHRSPEFVALYEMTRRRLSEIVGGLPTAIFCGSGTLANDVVASTLAADRSLRRGVVLVNGEFGHRLAEQAQRVGLDPQVLQWDWGQPWDLEQLEALLARSPDINWLWAVHLETSTGMLNDIDALLGSVAGRNVRVCLDCISSLGAVPLDLSGVHLASAASGKALGAFAGLSFVFAAPDALKNVETSAPATYLDLAAVLQGIGPRFTIASPLLAALAKALEVFSTATSRRACYERCAALGRYVRAQLRSLGLQPLVDGPHAAPVITTFRAPAGERSTDFLDRCRSWGFDVHGHSPYLADRGLVQIATMGCISECDCAALFSRLRDHYQRHGAEESGDGESSPPPRVADPARSGS